jgi:large subunit ribosomal protein L10
MNRQEKAGLIELLKQDFNQSNALFCINYQGLSVNQLQTLRTDLRKQNGKFKIAKVRIVKRAFSDLPLTDALLSQLKNQLGVVFSAGEPNAVAKVLYDFSRKNEALQIVVGHFENQVLDKNGIKFLATLPSREVLLARVCGTLMAPITCLAVVLKKASEKES